MAPAPQLMFHCVAMEEEAWLLYSGVYHLKGLGRQTGGLATEISAASIQTSGLARSICSLQKHHLSVCSFEHLCVPALVAH